MSIFPTTILLATDGSLDAALALETAVDLANTTNSELHVVTAARGYPAYDIRIEEVAEQLRQEAQEVLDEQVRRVDEVGGTVQEAHVRVGERRSDEIVKVAEEVRAGLIVMGSRGLGGVRRTLMGSVSDAVVRHAHCPVLIVRRREDAVGGS
ncbi:MAG: universal stress protein [Actinomycetota bacterium]|nr:universal stress protein [Actinomycetota bacterium]